METRITSALKLIACSALIGFAFTACTTDSETDLTTDGGNVVVAQEATNMGVVLNESDSSAAGKLSAAGSDTILDVITKEKIIVRRHYDTACQCFVRTALFTSSKGFERQRQDSIWLDSSGHSLAVFVPGHADSITHVRHVTRINANTGKEIDLTFRTTLTLNLNRTMIAYQWNGVITGSFNGTEFTNSTFSIAREFILGTGFGDLNGTIDIHRGDFEISIVFWDGTITCTVTNKGNPVRTTHIDSDGNET